MATNIAKSTAFQVIFTRRSALQGPAPNRTILIAPSLSAWNDFGFKSRAEARIHITDDLDFLVNIYIGFITDSPEDINGTYKLESLAPTHDYLDHENTKDVPFFTMHYSMEDYRKTVAMLGKASAAQVLKAMNDLVALSEFQPRSPLLKTAVKSEIFTKSFIRSSESYFSFKSSGSILRGLKSEKFETFSKNLECKFKLAKFNNPHTISLRFDHDDLLPKRVCVLIGKNGVGKSQALSELAKSLLAGNNTLTDLDTQQRPVFNRLLAFAPTKETLKNFPLERRKRPLIWYRRFSLNRAGSENDMLTDQILQVSRSGQFIGEWSRWDIFLSAIEAIENWNQIHVQTDDPDKFLNLNELTLANEKRILDRHASVDIKRDPIRLIAGKAYPLSSGESSFLRFAAQASLHIENGSLLLLDEPETHLHPNFINQFMLLLDNLLKPTGSAAIIATHSAYFVREVFREQVTIIRSTKDGQVEFPLIALQTFGSDVGLISNFVFEEDDLSSLASAIESKIISRYQNWDVIYAKYGAALSPQLLSSIRLRLEKAKK